MHRITTNIARCVDIYPIILIHGRTPTMDPLLRTLNNVRYVGTVHQLHILAPTHIILLSITIVVPCVGISSRREIIPLPRKHK